jgi:excisionase family DNA binding protein
MPTNAPLDPRRQAARSDTGIYDLLLTPAEAAAYLRVSKSYLDKLRVYGGGPKFLRPSKRKILYRKSDLDLWATERTFTSTSEYDDPAKDQGEDTSNIGKEYTTVHEA